MKFLIHIYIINLIIIIRYTCIPMLQQSIKTCFSFAHYSDLQSKLSCILDMLQNILGKRCDLLYFVLGIGCSLTPLPGKDLSTDLAFYAGISSLFLHSRGFEIGRAHV